MGRMETGGCFQPAWSRWHKHVFNNKNRSLSVDALKTAMEETELAGCLTVIQNWEAITWKIRVEKQLRACAEKWLLKRTRHGSCSWRWIQAAIEDLRSLTNRRQNTGKGTRDASSPSLSLALIRYFMSGDSQWLNEAHECLFVCYTRQTLCPEEKIIICRCVDSGNLQETVDYFLASVALKVGQLYITQSNLNDCNDFIFYFF